MSWTESAIAQLKRSTAAYRLHYAVPRARAFFGRPRARASIVFVVPAYARGWILEAICHEIAARLEGPQAFAYSTAALPPADNYFIAHQALVPDVLKSNPCVWNARRMAFYTHPSDPFVGAEQFIYALNKLDVVFFMCTAFRRLLRGEGLTTGADVIFAGADPSVFLPHSRGTGVIGICSAYYPRKDPDRLLALVSAMPDVKFLLVGRGWQDYPRFAELLQRVNFEYAEAKYSEYPKLYGRMDVIFSMARLEGGPIPLLEAMMSDAFPVASRTGFAPDIIDDGVNGYLFDENATTDEILPLLRRALANRESVRSSVVAYTWDRFAAGVRKWMRS